MDFLPCGIVKFDTERKVIHANRYALNLWSCESSSTIIGKSVDNLVSLATRIFIDSYVYPMLLDEGRADEVQLSLKSQAGEAVPIVANIQINHDKTVCWAFMSCVNRNKLYTELLTARDTLQSQALSLTQYNTQIQERQSDLQAFCQSLSHDFTGPLRLMRQAIAIAVEDFQQTGIAAPDGFKMLNRAQENSDTLIEMAEGLVEYLVADVVVSHDEVVYLEEIVASVLAMCEEQQTKAPKVHQTSLPTLVGNKSQMQVLFKNLIENSIKYNENQPEITISHTEDVANGCIVITIEDNGIGMSEASLESIFTPFTRLDTTNKYKGSGLGLSIAKKMVMNHDGDIRAESTLGIGTTFYVSLPIQGPSSDKP